jgi:hypothetical protein
MNCDGEPMTGNFFVKIVFSMLLTFFSSLVYPAELKSYSEIEYALTHGENVSIVSDFDKCTEKMHVHKVIGGLLITSYLIINHDTIKFSDWHPMITPDKKINYEYIKYDVKNDGTVIIKSFSINPRIVNKYTCHISNGASFYVPDI